MSTPGTPTRPREGFALPVTLFALIVIGAIVTGGFYLSAQETRIVASSDLGTQAFSVAEYGLQEVLGTWRNQDVTDASTETSPRTGDAWAGTTHLGDYAVTVDALGGRLYVIRVAGTASRGARSTTRTVAMLTRTTSAALPYESALSVLGGLSAEGQADISGTDACDATNVLPGVSKPPSSSVTESGNATVTGDPPVANETQMDETTLSQFGDVDLQDLIDSATKIYADGANPTNMQPVTTTDGSGNTICDTSVQSNWGDTIATNTCGDYYPITYGQGDLTLNGSGQGGMGQGILVVEGNLTIDGNVKFKGVVITKGDLYYAGNGGHVEGAMIVMGSGTSTSAGSSELNYNSCIVEDVFNGGLRARPLDARSWVDLSGTVKPLAPT